MISEVYYEADINGKFYSRALENIIYDHITPQTRFPKSDVSLIKFDINFKANKIAYLMGSGDKVPESLSLVGYEVDLLEKSDININKLKCSGWGQQAEILTFIVNKKSKIFEIGISYHGRTYEEGKKIKYYDVFSVIFWIVTTKVRKFFL